MRHELVPRAEPKVLKRRMVCPVIPFSRRGRAGRATGAMRRVAVISRSDVRESSADSQSIGEAELGFHDERVRVDMIDAAGARHAIPVEIEMAVCGQVLVGDRDIAFARGRHEGLRARIAPRHGETRADERDHRTDVWDALRQIAHGRRAAARSRLSFSSIALSTAAQ